MKNSSIIVSCLLSIAFGFSGCKKDVPGATGAQGPVGPAGPAYMATLSGFVTVYDQYGTKLFTNLNKVQVSIDGTSRSASSDTSGKYSFASLTTGNYNITASDSGCGIVKAQDIQLVSGNVNRDIKLSQIPSFSIATCIAIDTVQNAVNYIKIRGTIASDVKSRMLIFFVGSNSSVSASTSTWDLFYTRAIAINATTFSLMIPASDLYAAQISSGSTVYIAAYPASVNYNTSSSYEDLTNGKTVFNAVGPSPINLNVLVP